MEEKVLNETLLGTSESNGIPLIARFPSDNEKTLVFMVSD